MESTPKQSFEAVPLESKQDESIRAHYEIKSLKDGPTTAASATARKEYRKRRLLFAIILCLVLFSLECVGAFVSQSLAIWADAFHMLSDVLGYLVSYLALSLSAKRDAGVGFGWKRVEVVGALASVAIMWMLAGNLMWEAVIRLFLLWEGRQEVVVEGKSMLAMAVGGVVVNTALIFIFGHEHDHHDRHQGNQEEEQDDKKIDFLLKGRGDKLKSKYDELSPFHHVTLDMEMENTFEEVEEVEEERQNLSPNARIPMPTFKGTAATDSSAVAKKSNHTHPHHTTQDINIRAAMLHAIGDLLCSLGVLLSALLIVMDPRLTWTDPVCTLVFSVVALATSIPVLYDIFGVLMQHGPPGWTRSTLQAQILEMTGTEAIVSIEQVKAWQVCPMQVVVSVECTVSSPARVNRVVQAIKMGFAKWNEEEGVSVVECTVQVTVLE